MYIVYWMFCCFLTAEADKPNRSMMKNDSFMGYESEHYISVQQNSTSCLTEVLF